MVSKDDLNMISGGHNEAERLPRGGGHHEGDETSKPGPGIKHVCATSAKLLTFGNTGQTHKLVEEVDRDIRFREKKMGKTRGDVAKPKSWMRRERICREIEDQPNTWQEEQCL